tara:strand:- start:4501 stop:5973 length:1473 start_codon:yes stop_codon:yes gene_type:complete
MSFSTTAAKLTPRPTKTLAWDNYLNINDLKFDQQFLPEVYEKEIERFGNRTISGFLTMVGAEMPMASDVVTWVEQGRLHVAFDNITKTDAQTITFNSADDLKLIGIGDTIVLGKGNNEVKAYVSAKPSTTTATVEAYSHNALSPGIDPLGADGTTGCSLFVYGSEYAKGSATGGNSIEAKSEFFDNKPIILRNKYTVAGSNVAQIGWIEVTTEAGTGGYLWYLKSEHESRLRFQDHLEMSMVEAEKAEASSFAATNGPSGAQSGSEGLFAAVEARGNVYTGADFGANLGFGAASAATGGSAAATVDYAANNGINEFDDILVQLDTQGAIEENMLFLDRQMALSFDNMLAAVNAPYGGGTSYGVFENSEDMALNLGFNGFRRGSYDFYKTDWKYLNDSTTRGGFANIEGVLVPAGVSTVYDQQLGTNIQRPFLHVRYRASEADDRRMKSWITGSVGGNFTSEEDAMNVHFLSERALCVQGANNFVLFKKIA